MLRLTPHTHATQRGRRPYQEDRAAVTTMEQGMLLMVFDGHGGDFCAEHSVNTFDNLFADEISQPLQTTVPDSLRRAFAKLNEETKDMNDGCSASVVFIPSSNDVAYVAVMGDSPVVIRQADGTIYVGPDHNVRSNLEEASRATSRGGYIFGGYLCRGMDGMGLQMARALGDAFLGNILLREPEIDTVSLSAGSFVLVATDGAFDPGHENTNEEIKKVVTLIQSGGDATAIVDRAVRIPTGDNVTALLVRIEDTSE